MPRPHAETSPTINMENVLPPLPVPALTGSARELADVLGRDRALYLIGQLPRCRVRDTRYTPRPGSQGSQRVILYVPKQLKPDHALVRILCWDEAQRLVSAFGGEIICPPTLLGVVYLPFRDQGLVELHRLGVSPAMLADWFGITETRVRQVLDSQTPQEACKNANDNTTRLVKPSSKKR